MTNFAISYLAKYEEVCKNVGKHEEVCNMNMLRQHGNIMSNCVYVTIIPNYRKG